MRGPMYQIFTDVKLRMLLRNETLEGLGHGVLEKTTSYSAPSSHFLISFHDGSSHTTDFIYERT